jgi:hypothetical protein
MSSSATRDGWRWRGGWCRWTSMGSVVLDQDDENEGIR